jgi:Sulfotransferase domain
MRKPNFFILGAPKCGTTSLAAWLGEHPEIFMPKLKEPHFFNTDDRQGVATLSDYESLFRGATGRHVAVGEASVWYLFSTEAVRNILRYQPQARFIVMVRNPVEMAPALHQEMLLSGHENVSNFQDAWNLQTERRQGRSLPPLGWARRRFLYGGCCALGAQLNRLLADVSKDAVLVVVLDDMNDNPRREYLRVLQFLGVKDDGRNEFPVHNKARMPRWPGVARFLFIMIQIRRKLGFKAGLNLWNIISRLNKIETPRPSLPPESTAALRKYFAGDVELLSQLLGRNLSYWLAP